MQGGFVISVRRPPGASPGRRWQRPQRRLRQIAPHWDGAIVERRHADKLPSESLQREHPVDARARASLHRRAPSSARWVLRKSDRLSRSRRRRSNERCRVGAKRPADRAGQSTQRPCPPSTSALRVAQSSLPESRTGLGHDRAAAVRPTTERARTPATDLLADASQRQKQLHDRQSFDVPSELVASARRARRRIAVSQLRRMASLPGWITSQ
jgi:hypothetical protein